MLCAGQQVWIYQEKLHLVPIEHTSALPFSTDSPSTADPSNEGFLDRVQALNLVRDPAVATLAPQALQDLVWARINGYAPLWPILWLGAHQLRSQLPGQGR